MATISIMIKMKTAASPEGMPMIMLPVNLTDTTKNITAQRAARSTRPLIPSR